MLKKTPFLFISIGFILLVLLTSCKPKSEEEIIGAVEKVAQEIFEEKDTMKINKELKHVSLYLPQELQLEEVMENNLVLTDGKQSYYIFYNELEEPTSELNFVNIDQTSKDILLIQSFKDAHKFGYVQVRSTEEAYELQIGIGGVKITTNTEKNNLVDQTEEIMKIARSIVENDQD